MNGKGGNQVDFNLIDQRDSVDGYHYVAYHAKGTFLAKYSMRHFPFDKQRLTLELENPLFEKKDYYFIPDTQSFHRAGGFLGIEKGMQVLEYRILSTSLESVDHEYTTDFGIPESGTGVSTFSRAVFELDITRQFADYLVKFLLPLLIILGVNYIVFFIDADKLEINAAICITALLTAVALGMSQGEPASSVGYLMTTDRFFFLTYAMILLSFVETVAVSRWAVSSPELAEKIHRGARLSFFSIYVAGLLLIAVLELVLP
jgi:hypothetical protein